jgi:hypothetical protein
METRHPQFHIRGSPQVKSESWGVGENGCLLDQKC